MNNPCLECGAYIGHSYICSSLTLEEARKMLIAGAQAHQKDMASMQRMMIRSRTNSELWHGKYTMVKHENNKLRNKLFLRK